VTTADGPEQGRALPTPAVVVAGDALVDLTPATTTTGHPAYEPHPGGSCLNVAVGLARLGVPTAFLARVSNDAFGALIRAHLAASGVLATYLLATSDLTTLAAVHVQDGIVSYSFHAAEAADRGLRPEHLLELPDRGRLPDGAALHVGSIALVQEPQASTLDGLLRRESRRRVVSLDPNVRSSLVPDRDAYLARMAEWVVLADVVKASDEDLAWLYPGEVPEVAARRWLDAGAALVLVTSGPRGAWAATQGAEVRVPAPVVEVVDTVGAGDAFTSGILAHLHGIGRLTRQGVEQLDAAELQRLLCFAVGVAADTCTRAGAEPPYRRPPGGSRDPAPETTHAS
jgi:fructokinase